ncbi:MAG: hypothetical protein IJV43_08985, partial [Oscillospiraceae bacterium]|nr:hypothetical protein [Oscillospiraceae bacterium]MBQ9721051.1 hypothetical protein [Oscillospiraceae bacterium]
QQAYDREDAATNRSYAAAMVNNMLENGIMPDEESLAAAGYTTSMAQSLLEAINAQKSRDLADYSAQYGDYSGLEGLGIDTSYLTAQQKAQLANLTASRSGGSYGGAASAVGENIYETLANAGIKDYGSAYAWLRSNGYSTIDANRYANYFANTYLTAEPTSDATKPIDTGGMDASTFNQEARAIMSYLGQGLGEQAQNRLAAIWNSLSEDQQRQLTDALVKNGYAS